MELTLVLIKCKTSMSFTFVKSVLAIRDDISLESFCWELIQRNKRNSSIVRAQNDE